MNIKVLFDALLKAEHALVCTHNTITTDIVGVEPDETHWRIDHTHELDAIQGALNAIRGEHPQKCPKCGCMCFDPFQGTVLLHDIELCGGIISIRHNNANAGEFGDAPNFKHCPSGHVHL